MNKGIRGVHHQPVPGVATGAIDRRYSQASEAKTGSSTVHKDGSGDRGPVQAKLQGSNIHLNTIPLLQA